MRRLYLLPAVLAPALALSACNAGDAAVQGARQFGDGFGDAATAPLADFNLRREYIPTVLLQAEANPYDVRNLNQCTTIGAEIARLNEALGPDSDEPRRPDQPNLTEIVTEEVVEEALDAIRDATTDFIPQRSWVRRLTGAKRAELRVKSAVQAGRMRRAFLKGVGMQHNCAPPAAPEWFRPRGGSRR